MIIQPHVLIKLTNIKNDLKLSGYVNRRSVREEDQRRFQTFIQVNSILFRVLSLIWKNVSFGESILPKWIENCRNEIYECLSSISKFRLVPRACLAPALVCTHRNIPLKPVRITNKPSKQQPEREPHSPSAKEPDSNRPNPEPEEPQPQRKKSSTHTPTEPNCDLNGPTAGRLPHTKPAT